jgi:hypothetical protein
MVSYMYTQCAVVDVQSCRGRPCCSSQGCANCPSGNCKGSTGNSRGHSINARSSSTYLHGDCQSSHRGKHAAAGRVHQQSQGAEFLGCSRRGNALESTRIFLTDCKSLILSQEVAKKSSIGKLVNKTRAKWKQATVDLPEVLQFSASLGSVLSHPVHLDLLASARSYAKCMSRHHIGGLSDCLFHGELAGPMGPRSMAVGSTTCEAPPHHHLHGTVDCAAACNPCSHCHTGLFIFSQHACLRRPSSCWHYPGWIVLLGWMYHAPVCRMMLCCSFGVCKWHHFRATAI